MDGVNRVAQTFLFWLGAIDLAMSGLQPTPSTHSGQKTAVELYDDGLKDALADLKAGKMPKNPFLGALTELFIAQIMGWKLASGKFDNFDAFNGIVTIEIKHSRNSKKPSAADKVFAEFCWVKLKKSGTKICATRITVERRWVPHLKDRLDRPRIIFDAANPPGADFIAWESIAV